MRVKMRARHGLLRAQQPAVRARAVLRPVTVRLPGAPAEPRRLLPGTYHAKSKSKV